MLYWDVLRPLFHVTHESLEFISKYQKVGNPEIQGNGYESYHCSNSALTILSKVIHI